MNISFRLFRAALQTHLVMIHNHSKDDIIKQRLNSILDIESGEDKDELQHVCEICFIKTETSSDLVKHLSQYHKDTALHMCPECLFKAPSYESLQKHMQKVKKVPKILS